MGLTDGKRMLIVGVVALMLGIMVLAGLRVTPGVLLVLGGAALIVRRVLETGRKAEEKTSRLQDGKWPPSGPKPC